MDTIISFEKTKRISPLEFSNTALDNLPLTMVYIPMQNFGKTYENETGLERGTLFPDIDKPFKGKMMR